MEVMLRSRSRVGIQVLLLLAWLASPGFAETLVTIDVPGASGTFAQGINNRGDVVGFYRGSDNHAHGFHWSSGVFTFIDMPDAVDTELYGVNDRGDIVGVAILAGFHNHYGFLLRDGVVHVIPGPPGEGFTTALDINNQGVIVGSFDLINIGVAGFWLDRRGTFHPIISSPFQVSGVNEKGEMVGHFGERSQGFFIDARGTFTPFDFPGARGTFPAGINERGVIAGTVWVSPENRGFLLDKGNFSLVDVPLALATMVSGINSKGDLVGSYVDGAGTHGFVLVK